MRPLRVLVRAGLAFGLVVAASAPAYAGVSPQGDTAAPWPPAWNTYRMADGSAVQDVLGDENPNNADLSSGPCSGTGCTGPSPTVYYASDGSTAFFRMRLAVDPSDATKGGLAGNAYLTQIAVNGTVVAVAGVDGKSASVDYVYVASAPGTTVTQVYTWPFTSPSNGMRVVPDGAGHYFLDYQVPIARLTAVSGGALTASTPVQLYYGSSAAANLATLNKDLMLGDATAVSFANLAVVSFTPATLAVTSGATLTSGPSPTVGQTSRYTVTWTMTNGGGGELSSATASATLPAGVTFVSGPGVSASGSTVTWSPGTVLPGQTKTVTFVVDLVPTSAGPTTPLLSAVSASATDVGTAGARTASAPALTVGPVAAAPPVNGVPAAADDTLTVAEDASAGVDVLANDTDDDALTVTVTGAPAHGTTSVAGGTVTYTPAANYAGPDSFTYTACDPSAACDTATVTVTVTPVNDPPSAPAPSSFTTPEDTAHSGTLPGGSDVDGDPLTFSVVTPPAHGTLTVNPGGTYTYTPEPDYAGGDTFTYQVCDPAPLCAAAVVTVTVTAVNDAPAPLAGTTVTTAEDTPVSGSLPAGSDPDGDPLAYSVVTPPAHGTVVVEPDGTYTYTPDANYSGGDTFGYRVCDAGPLCAAAVATVTVTPVNDPPAAPAGTSFSTPADTPHTGTLPGSTDPDGDPLTHSLVSGPAHGTVAVSPDGTFTYTPEAGYAGGDAFTYQVCDGGGLCASAVATVTVLAPGNVAPVAADDTATTAFGAAVTIPVLANDVDTDALTVTATSTPAHGSVAVVAGGVTYTPAPGFSGTDSFTYTACDPTDACDGATVTVTVAPKPNAAPVADAGSDASTLPPALVHLDGTGSSDPDGDPLTYAWTQVGGPAVTLLGAATATPSFSLTQPGTYLFSLTVSDGSLTSTDTVTVAAAFVVVDDVPPDCTDVTVTANGATVTVTPDCDSVVDGATIVIVDGPDHGDAEVLDSGAIRYVPDPGWTGSDRLTLRICNRLQCTETVITVLNGSVARPSRLPSTGSGTEVLVPLGVLLVLAGVGLQRRRAC
ncbi:MAG TPA: Ig-like domain-containing protein [Mycobacteriales bacterium]|jgi:VCBS repeat-containing protein